MVSMEHCPRCGAKLLAAAAFCHSCGLSVAAYAASSGGQMLTACYVPRRSFWRKALRVLGLSTVFVVGVFTGAALIVAENERTTYVAPIEAVLKLHAGMDAEFQTARSKSANPIHAIEVYIQGIKRIDTSPCPDDFREAFFRYGTAWERYHDALKARETAQVTGVVQLLAAFLLEDPSMGASSLQSLAADDPSSSEIFSTWAEVQAVAIRHGAVLKEQGTKR